MGAKTTFRRLWSILLALVLVVGMMPTTALAEGETPTQATATADFSADPTAARVLLNAAKTGETDSTWDSTTKTLPLNGINFSTTHHVAVRLPGESTIVLPDGTTNTITGGNLTYHDWCRGIQADGDLTITIPDDSDGTGKLIVTGGDTTGKYACSHGIYSERGNVIIRGGTIYATGGTIAYSNSETYSCGIRASYSAKNVSIEGGTVIATGGKGSGYSCGIYGDNPMYISGGTVIAKGDDDVYESYGLYNYMSIVLQGGTVTATGRTEGICAYSQYGNVIYAGYPITFVGSPGTGKMNGAIGSSKTGEYQYTLPANSFVVPSYKYKKFKCWDVNGEEKAVGDTITISDDTTVTAVWEDITFDVTVTNGSASVEGKPVTAAAKNTEVTLTAKEIDGKVFDKWEVVSGYITLEDSWSAITTFTMPTSAVSVKATYIDAISSVAITDIDAPASNAALDTTAACATTGVSSTTPTARWAASDSNAR